MINKFGKYRPEILGEYVIENKATVRRTAHHFGISKSTVHKDLTGRLRIINPAMFAEVKTVLDLNKSERHLRGGEATRQKYMIERTQKKKYGRNEKR